MSQAAQKLPPFPSGWYSCGGLGPVRPCDATYCYVSYESLPPIPETFLQGTLHWLTPLDQDIKRQYHDYSPPQDLFSVQWKKIMTSAQQVGLVLPDAFRQLMNSAELRGRIPSCTDCYFELSEKLVPCPGSEEGYIIRFLNAAQGQIAWYLYLTPQGGHCVLVGYPLLDLVGDPENPAYSDQGITEEERKMAFEGKGAFVCAFSFEEFLYRFWIENLLWYKLVWYKGQQSLTEEEKQYLSYYTDPDDQG